MSAHLHLLAARHVVRRALLGVRVSNRTLISDCNPMACPIHVFKVGDQKNLADKPINLKIFSPNVRRLEIPSLSPALTANSSELHTLCVTVYVD